MKHDRSMSLPRWKFSSEYSRKSTHALNTALDKVPLYKSWRPFDPRNGDIDTRYSCMPALTKRDIRKNFPMSILPNDKDMQLGLASGEIELVETSGTTNDRITNIWNQPWWDASEKASWKLNSFTGALDYENHREAILVNPLNVGVASNDVDLPMEKRKLSRFLYLNEKTDVLSWTPSLMDRMVQELNDYRPDIIEANPSYLARLSRYVSSNGKNVYQPSVVIFTYEYPTQLHYKQISRVFSVPLISSYGSTETGYVFMQCEAGNFHQNTDYCRVDFQPLRREHGGLTLGRILVTPLGNPWSYLLRFDTGDLVHIKENAKCPCGRNSGIILQSISGRAVNLTTTTRGRLVSLRELDSIISQLNGLDQYQLIQSEKNEYELHLVGPRVDRDNLAVEAERLLKELYGEDAAVSIKHDSDIAPEISGKYLVSKTTFDIDIEEYLDRD